MERGSRGVYLAPCISIIWVKPRPVNQGGTVEDMLLQLVPPSAKGYGSRPAGRPRSEISGADLVGHMGKMIPLYDAHDSPAASNLTDEKEMGRDLAEAQLPGEDR
ncbi:hypothetical protein GUJ93_ZPchr0008g13546 [Zizania palustris]|uniref:Uncharacterized protein n=1 Tax=Zizania palustris TaxID=103762 RepID=A0A8J5RE83_ZIZPA|nr:hypothetical protein GUJ93_ZPchr0008g13546 [Zizania palustris]